MIKKIFLFFILYFVSCGPNLKRPYCFYPESLQKVSLSTDGVVSTAHPLATKAGVSILEKGGNAIDAAVASAFTLSVVEPSMSGIGGRTQILIYSPNSGFHPSIGVPGVVKGLSKALSEHGTLPRKDIMSPSIQLANEGHELITGEAIRQSMVYEQLKEFEGSRQYFLNPDGSSRRPGQWVVQKDLAKVLQAISDEGEKVFYEGWIAEMMVKDNQGHSLFSSTRKMVLMK